MSDYVGIDVAKHKHVVSVLDSAGRVALKPFSVSNDREGMEHLLRVLQSLNEPLKIGLEATGHYWLSIYDQLTQAGYSVTVLNPLQVHAYQKSGVRKRKSDPVDAWWIADYVRVSQEQSSSVPVEVALQLRHLARFRFSLVEQIGDAKPRILGMLDRVFPEYEQFFSDVFITTSRRLLTEAVTAADFVAFDLDELTGLVNKTSRGRFRSDKAQALQSLARRSIGVSFMADAARVEIGCLLAQLTFLEGQIDEVEVALTDLVERLPTQHLTSIPDIGSTIAAILLGEIGDVRRFGSLEKLVAYASIDPTLYQSGNFQATQSHMSKRGSPFLRHALWLAATAARQHDPELRAYYEKRRAEGKPYGTVMGAICHKLLARIYAVLRDQRPYVVH